MSNTTMKNPGASAGAPSAPLKITPRAEDYSRWYHDVIRQAELAEAAEVVKGCMVIKPHGYAIWEKIQRALDDLFKATGHQNAYFPLLIPQSFLQKEAEHVEGFAPELAVVTHAGGKLLEEPYVIRPTSETIIGHFFAKWIESWRDLPLLINQWANVMRWELRTRLFLRTGEFLWQEGHTAHATHAEARAEVLTMLRIYAKFAREWMALPVICGRKTETEKFAGALASYCIEAMMQDGKALQAGTSHDLGQNFGKAFNVCFQNQEGVNEYVWQTSWGVSTRLIGGLIMAHSDDQGLVLPPKLAPVQVVIIPIFHKAVANAELLNFATSLKTDLLQAGISTVVDERDYKPGFKYFAWEQKGVPLRIELGPRDLAAQQLTVKTRLATEKITLARPGAVEKISLLLQEFQQELYERAAQHLADNTLEVTDYQHFKEIFTSEPGKFVKAYWDGTKETEALIKEETKATIRCLPIAEETGVELSAPQGVCIYSGKPTEKLVIFAKAY